MNATPDQQAAPRTLASHSASISTIPHNESPVDPPIPHDTWFTSYDEEWAAFLVEKASRKSRPGSSVGDSEVLPRVWNTPV